MSWVLRNVVLLLLIAKFRYILTQRSCPPKDAILPCRCLLRLQEYQIWCSNSNLPNVLNSLKSIAKHIPHPVDEMILEHNFLTSLPGRTFAPLRVLRLMLRHNNLERVSSDFLAGLETSLMEIFIVEPRLSTLPASSLARLKNLRAATISSELLTRLPPFSGLPKLRYVYVQLTSLSELAAINFKHLPSLESLHINASPKLTRLESHLLEDLPKLELVNVTRCGVHWIHARAFRRLPALRELSLTGNKITDARLVGRAIRELPALEVVKLDDNKVDNIGEASFMDSPSLSKIDLANNIITRVQQGAFHNLPKLKILDVSNNALRYFHPDSFSPSENTLEEILVPHNNLTDIRELRSILDSSPRLIFLDMSHNQVRSIPFGTLRGHPTLEQIDMGYNSMVSIDKEAFTAMPALRELKLANNSVTDLSSSPLWNLPSLKGLDLARNGIARLEPSFLSNVAALRRVDLSQNSLSFVDPEAFLRTPALEHINMSHNALKGLHVVTLRHLRQLYEIDVGHNHLRAVPGGLPGNLEYLRLKDNEIIRLSPLELDLPSLRLLDLSKNMIDNIPGGSLKGLVNLKRFYLGRNLLTNLETYSLDGLGNLETLDLSNNRLVQIYQNSLKALVSLRYFNVENNRLSVLGSELLMFCKNVVQINLSGNQLPDISARTLESNKRTEFLDLSDNLLVQIPQTIHGNSNLKKLYLTNNRIKDINTTLLNSLINLRELKLSRNFIKAIEEGSFSEQKHLKTIHLNDNEIDFMEPNCIRNLPVLKSLKLDRNKLERLPKTILHNLPSLRSLELQHNRLRSIEPRAFSQIPHLLTLNLSHNYLTTLEDAGVQTLDSLELLDLSYNRIKKLSGKSLDHLEWMVELRMDGNSICEVNEGVFDKLLRLKLLSIRNNKITYIPEMAAQRLLSNVATIDVKGNPLICKCNMLWLQAWIKETAQESPSCSDGMLLRELRLSTQDCPQEERQKKGLTMCDADIFDTHSLYSTSQVLSIPEYNLTPNGTRNSFSEKNNLAPTPEESEYFYDYYIDYPQNGSLMDSKVSGEEKRKNGEDSTNQSILEKFLQATSSDNVTGDTPTLYAALSKIPKPNIPQRVSHSPSNSGFTFFGIPLPDVNLNNLFAKDQPRTAVMQRKSAIVNDPADTKKKIQAQMETIQPHKMPELQGGFVPVLPGFGGFKPMPDPSSANNYPERKQEMLQQTRQVEMYKKQMIQNIQSVVAQKKVTQNVHSQKQPMIKNEQNLERPEQQVVLNAQQVEPHEQHVQQVEPQRNQQNLTKQLEPHIQQVEPEKQQILQNLQQMESQKSSMAQNERQVKQQAKGQMEQIEQAHKFSLEESNHSTFFNFNSDSAPKSRNKKSKLDSIKLETIANVKISDQTVDNPSKEFLSTEILNSTSQKISTSKDVEKTTEETVTDIVETSTFTGGDKGTTLQPTEATYIDPNIADKRKVEQVVEEKTSPPNTETDKPYNGSFLSILTVPDGQHYEVKPTAKSTITKVLNPHNDHTNNVPSQLSLGDTDFPNFAEVKSARVENVDTDNPITTSTTKNWYFENYNKQDIRPFVSTIRGESAGPIGCEVFVYSYLIAAVVLVI